jgi:sporulation protein YlmC with PRC-barrel domain
MNAERVSVPSWVAAVMSLVLLPGWVGTARAGNAGPSSAPAIPEQDVWRRWEAARETRRAQGGSESVESAPAPANKARDILGMEVRSKKDERIGQVEDVVLDWRSGRISYALVKADAQGGAEGGKLLAVPAAALKPSADRKHLVIDAGKF